MEICPTRRHPTIKITKELTTSSFVALYSSGVYATTYTIGEEVAEQELSEVGVREGHIIMAWQKKG